MAKKSVQGNARKNVARQAAAAAAEATDDAADTVYPKAKYRKVKPSAKYPNGYETKRVEDEAHEAKLGSDWKDSTEGMTPDVPFGHQD